MRSYHRPFYCLWTCEIIFFDVHFALEQSLLLPSVVFAFSSPTKASFLAGILNFLYFCVILLNYTDPDGRKLSLDAVYFHYLQIYTKYAALAQWQSLGFDPEQGRDF